MKKLWPFILSVAMVSAGCVAIAPNRSESSGDNRQAEVRLTHNFFGEKDDLIEKLGKNVTYALIELNSGGHWQLVALSKTRLSIRNEHQEMIQISNDYTNVVPSFDKFNIQYSEDPVTGVQSRWTLDCLLGRDDIVLKKTSYGPCNSEFFGGDQTSTAPRSTGQIIQEADRRWIYGPGTSGSGRMVKPGFRTGALDKGVAETNLMANARAFNEGRPVAYNLSNLSSQHSALVVSDVWLVRARGRGDMERFLFKPEKYMNKGDPVTEDQMVMVNTSPAGVFNWGRKYSSVSEIKSIKYYDHGKPDFGPTMGGHACESGLLRLKAEGEAKKIFVCTYEESREMFLFGKDTERLFPVTSIAGTMKKIYTNDRWTPTNYKFSPQGIDELVVLSPEEANKYGNPR
jgi:hypothetical protein